MGSSGCILRAKYDSTLGLVGVLRPFFVQKEVQMQQLKIIFDGTPDVYALLASEQKVFFSTLLERIIMLKQQDN